MLLCYNTVLMCLLKSSHEEMKLVLIRKAKSEINQEVVMTLKLLLYIPGSKNLAVKCILTNLLITLISNF
jgi:hypothetical protein